MNDTVSDPFSSLYTSLRLCKDKKYIRVLDLGGISQSRQSGSSDASQNQPYELRCQLRVVDLDENARPKFIALSYVWGQVSSKEPRTIVCGGHSKVITDNCWEALSQLRDAPDPDRNTDGSITLWVDAICINQADEEEKLHQIRLMGDIYSQAASVCVWLGPGTPQSDKVMDYLEVAGFQDYIVGDDRALQLGISPLTYWKLAFKIFSNCNIQGFLHPRNKPDRLLNLLIVGDRYLPSSDFMDEIFGRPWVSRIWTLQETLLASRIRIRCGTKSLDWSHMLYALTWFSYVLEACRTRGWHNLGLPWGGVVDTTGFERWHGLAGLWMKIHDSSYLGGDMNGHSITTGYTDSRMMADYRIAIAKIILIYQVVLGSILWVIFLPLFLIYCIYKIGYLVFTIPWLVVNTKVRLREYREAWTHSRYYVFSTLSSQLLTYSERHSLPTEQSPDASTTLGADLVREIWQRAATDPRDKSHGVHSVLRKLGVQVVDPTPGTHCHDLYRELYSPTWRSGLTPGCVLVRAYGPQHKWVRIPLWSNQKWSDSGFSLGIAGR
ncbi:heterokaryon incompatibility protein-domain-containing protein [Daldinia loculata]|uniref:heterokaryon incompatibility protein-domain-containing protein n=1 Tax=Daldinia loculata TaxID=103429 RepID=UPI0020C5AE3B|nr:heterokaryon incompatibility protein-domain-containing protein [Daldinia loculata]KAI1647917.1 heterokaryon incompatibility protein-domain-containing protein [Daldinia loculata]